MDFAGKVAIITGGCGGIGKAMCRKLLNIGMKVVICDIDESAGKSFIGNLGDEFKSKVIFQKCDVTCFDQLKAVFEKAKTEFGRIDVVVNNAGILNEKQWKKMIDINFTAVVNGIHLAFEYMGINNGGSGGMIVNTASNAGLDGFDVAPVYSGSKHAIVGLTRSYGQKYHFDKIGVTVNAILPGPVDTDMYSMFPKGSLDEKNAREQFAKVVPISADEVAKGLLQLLRDGKNGALLKVDDDGINYAFNEESPIFK